MNTTDRYIEVSKERKRITKKIRDLLKDNKVREYLVLLDMNDKLYNLQLDLYKQMTFEKFDSCDHIFVCTNVSYDIHHGGKIKRYGCIKCGLDDSVLKKDTSNVTFDEGIMIEYLDRHLHRGINTGYICDLSLARAIYKRIIETHPDIDEKTAIKYFEIALDNIRNKPVSEERKEDRAKRLSLSKGFNNWTEESVCTRK